ncbi:MAG: LysM peptidoglycan-binding domain-containing protein [Phycisphaerales bacterium]|nr:LysM peptidoglycan-binding domain-containing protein [Phycisphaerales bacterium]
MADQWGRVIAGSAALAVLWIGVYWAWEPAPPPITYGASPEPASEAGPDATPAHVNPADSRPVQTPVPAPKPQAPVPAPEPADAGDAKAVAPQFTKYRVQPGDSLNSIAAKMLGSSRHATAIAKANPLKDPQRLRAGEEIRIPLDPENIQGRDTGPAPARAAGSREYKVESGDTLSSISKQFYGTVKHAELIFEANRAVLKSPDDIREGQKLTIPPKPAGGPS